MLDKLLLNNQILANKKTVRKVRVNLVNKQVQKLRKLQKLVEKHPEKKKLKQKITRTSEILTCLKKTYSNVILREALLYEKNALAVITNGLSTPQEVAVALYVSHKSIETVVMNLKTILNIDDSDRSWRDVVTEPGKRKKKQLRTEKKQKIRQERKARNELSRKRNEWLVENLPQQSDVEQIDQNDENDIETKTVLAKNPKSEKQEEIKQKPIKSEEKVEIISFRQPEWSDQSSPEDDEPNISNDRHAVDDFFITQSGEHYLSTAVIDRVQPEVPDDGMIRRDRRALQNNRSTSSGKRKIPENRNKRKIPENGWNREKAIGSMRSDKKTSTRTGVKENMKHQKLLHPSWAAKQTQKGIMPFKGSKIVYDDSDNVVKQSEKKSSIKVKTNGSTEKLHPSWEAKQKLKPAISEFKGTKIVFNEE